MVKRKMSLNKRMILLLLVFTARVASAQQPGRESFDQFINNDTDGSSFEEAIVLPDECDYSKCKTYDCLLEVFNQTVFGQELKYVSENYGKRGKDWEVSGFDEVNAYVFDNDRYYDDLGVEIMGAGKTKVLHFDVTAPVNTFRQRSFNYR